MNTKKMCLVAVLTSLYCVLASLMKFTIIGNISIDLGYIVLAVAVMTVGPWAGFVGAVGCGLESILFSAYGFSIGWFVGNLLIGLIAGSLVPKVKKVWLKYLIVVLSVAIGILITKTGIECYLYHLPLAVKLPKSFTAFLVDSIAMCVGLPFALHLPKVRK